MHLLSPFLDKVVIQNSGGTYVINDETATIAIPSGFGKQKVQDMKGNEVIKQVPYFNKFNLFLGSPNVAAHLDSQPQVTVLPEDFQLFRELVASKPSDVELVRIQVAKEQAEKAAVVKPAPVKKVEIPGVQSLVDAKGVTFDPAIHEVTKDGAPRKVMGKYFMAKKAN